jgi:transcriptional regulator with XRE-family HTH domain
MTNNRLESLGERLKILRIQKGMTQMDLAYAAGVSISTISELETGQQKNPTIKTLMDIARALGLPETVFFEDSEYATILDFLKYLPPDIQSFVRHQENIPWMQLAIKFKEMQVTPELVEQLIVMIRRAKEVVEN